jgi:hypothetical protein
MAAVTTVTTRTRVDGGTSAPAVPWNRMGWITWRQHRVALAGVVVCLLGAAVYLWRTGLQLHHAYGAVLACHPRGSSLCFERTSDFNGVANFLTNGGILQVIPALIGAFIGAPVLARELETGTFRYAWTQGFGRWRWTLAKLVALGTVVAGIAVTASLVFSWYFQPYFGAQNQTLSLQQVPSLAPSLFNVRGPAFAAWTLVAFAIGCLAGLLIRRVVPAIVVTLAAYAALGVAAGGFLRQHYTTPLASHALSAFGTAWVLSQQWLLRGHPASWSTVNQVLLRGGAQVSGKDGPDPYSLVAWRYLAHHGFTRLTTYQPASRFWTFQWIETGWLLALAALCIATTVWLVRRKVA